MRKHNTLYRVLTILLALIVPFGSIASAHNMEFLEKTIRENLDYMDDVWKYDIPYMTRVDDAGTDSPQEEKVTETLKYAKADNIMAALGLLSFDSEGLYNEEGIVSYEEYMTIMTKLRYGSGVESENYGVDTSKDENVTHLMAVKELMDILGYTLSFDNDTAILNMAYRLNLLNKIDYRAAKYITRGELSQLVYNALSIDLMEVYSAGARTEYKPTDGKNLLDMIFGLTEISGLCSAAGGIDIYSNAYLEKDEIAIDGHRFITNAEDTSAFLGKRVYALLENETSKKVAFVGVDESDTSFTAPLGELEFVGGKICYRSKDTDKKVTPTAIKTYVYNGEAVISYSIDNDLLEKEGTITFASSERNGKYDVAIINVYETYIVDYISKTPSVRLYFKYNSIFDGKNYIDLDEDEDEKKTVVITKDGKSALPSEIASGDTVSILKSADNSYIYVGASSKSLTSTIDDIVEENILRIDNKEYVVSESCLELIRCGENDIELETGLNVSVKISALNTVADIVATSDVSKYAILKQFGGVGTKLNPQYQMKVYAESGFWEVLEFAKELTVDGKTNLTAQEANDILLAEKDSICFKPIRYKQNEDGEIIFIDTVIEERAEKSDEDAIVQSHVWPAVNQMAKTDWTKGTNLKGTTYSIAENAVIFKLPNDLEREDQYIRYRRSQIPAEALVNFVIYNADEFFRGDLIIYTAPESSSSSYESSLNIMISEVWVAKDENDNEVYKIVGYSSNKTTGANLVEIYTTSEYKDTHSDLKPGDVISYMTDADGYAYSIGQFITAEKAMNPANDRVTLEDYNEALGTVLAVDVKGRQVKLRVGEERFDKTNEYAVEEQGGCLFDSKTGEVYPITAADIRPGDRVFIRGLYRKNGIFIFR
ncbi:MAG: hypothetical protein IKA17_05435 [Clostridia bacterium]|nr:hypothetical protein [Clostridia bacterium]